MLKKLRHLDLKPTQILILGFMGLIIIGTILLELPIASNDGKSVGFVDAFFTATSAVCVTGLVVKNSMEHWTMFGKTVIIILIQIGGLGFMTLATTFFMLLGRKIGLKERLVIQEALNQNAISGMVRLTRSILLGTALVEGTGALLLATNFLIEGRGVVESIGLGIFHSISAFCNAGFDILSTSSLSPFVHNPLVNFTVILLIVLGGLGFTVWLDLIKVTRIKHRKKLGLRQWFQKLSLHSKLVLTLTGSLLAVGFVLFFLMEMNNPGTMGEYTLPQKVMAAMFQSVTPRTAGFNTIDLAAMTEGSKFLTIIFMFIGGSPAGTAGGVKTVTIGVLFFSVVSVIRSRSETEVYNKRIPEDIIKRALAVIMISLAVVIAVTITLTITEAELLASGQFNFMDVFFEAVSAFATVGLTLGITPELSVLGKLVICVTMFIGRLGPMTMAVGFALRSRNRSASIRKPEERVMVG
jgi:trk system potassium uptake protein TrkH